jgi:tol-pal system protein YbgF
MIRWCLGLVLVASLMPGCAAQKQRINSHQREIDNIQREIRFLKEQNSRLLREIDQINSRFDEIKQGDQTLKADMLSQIASLREVVDALQNQYKDTNYRITALNQQTPSSRPVVTAPATSNAEAPTEGEEPVSQSTEDLLNDESRQLYNVAYRDLIKGNYQLALEGFRQFVTQYPGSELTDNAQYWIGEVFYSQGRYANAIDEFEKVVQQYEKGDKVPDALLKIGYSYINMEEIEQAKLYLEEVIREHPDAEAANLAKGRLATLN